MSNVQEKFQERMEIRSDLLSGKKPKRVFVAPMFTLEAACWYAGIDLLQAHFNIELAEQAFDKIGADFPSDTLPVLNLRYVSTYHILGAKNWITGSDGTIQHPEIETMRAEDYDEFIKAPYKTIIEKFLPRVCTNLDKDPITSGLNLSKAFIDYKRISGLTGAA